MSGSSLEHQKNITVKIHIPDDQEHVLAQNLPTSVTAKHLIEDLAKKFKVEIKHLAIFQQDQEVFNNQRLLDLKLNDFGIVEVQLKLTEDGFLDNIKLDTAVYYRAFTLPDIITVHISSDDLEEGENTSRDLVVEIENKSIKKPFLGGFVNKKTNLEYHHAFTQTGPTLENIEKMKESALCRDTQTVEVKKTAIDTNYERSTQFFGDADELLFLQENSDYELEAMKNYESHEDMVKRKKVLEKVIIIQRNFRRYRLTCCITICATEYRRLQTIKRKREAKIKEDYINSYKKTGNFPRTKKDFDMLFAQIATWKETEIKRITEQFTGPSRIVEMQVLLEKEIQLLNGIEKRRCDLQREMINQKQDKTLEKYGETVKWIGYRNSLIEMDTIRTQRARKLTEYYKKLQQVSETVQDRIRMLNTITDVLSMENTNETFELENLFQRERELLLCKLSDDNLDVLRRRQLVVFMDVIKDERNNKPEKTITRICEKCKSVLSVSGFVTHSRQKEYEICKKCSSLKSSKTDLSVYRAILRGIQREERRRGALASFAFIISENDIKYIIEHIWHGHSILSQCSITSDLRLPRWNNNDEWAPWNCICLTDSESRIHVQCIDLNLIYGDKIMIECLSKHSLAKSTFKHLKKIDQSFVDSDNWIEAGIRDKVV